MSATPQLSIRMSPALKAELQRLAESDRRSLTWIVHEACRLYLLAHAPEENADA